MTATANRRMIQKKVDHQGLVERGRRAGPDAPLGGHRGKPSAALGKATCAEPPILIRRYYKVMQDRLSRAVVFVLLAAPQGLAAASVSEARLRADVRFLASDLLEGRGPGSRGDALAQAYIATQMEAAGLQPGAPGGGWLQTFDLVGIDSKVPDTVTFSAGAKTASLRYRDDFIAVAGVQGETARLDKAEVVFVGYGMVAPEYDWDDFKGMDLKGKVLLVMNNDPADDPALFAGKTRLYYGRWDYKYASAARVGAAGALVIHTVPSAGYPWQVVQTSWTGEQFELPDEGQPRLQVKGWTTEEATRRIVALAGKDLDALRAAAEKRDFKPVPLGVTVSLDLRNSVRRQKTANVIGKLPGAHATRAREAVVYTAHHDHLGTKADAKPGEDAIYNGAVDNASGVAALLEIARVMGSLPERPTRTVLFAAVAAEEQGLLGSQYLAAHPPLPHGRMAANVNIDGINIHGRTRDVTMIGLGKSDVDDIVKAAASAQGDRVVVPDAFPDRGYFYRSDQFNLAKVGVPAVYLSEGTDVVGKPEGWGKQQHERFEATDYHQPSDELRDDWNWEGAVLDTELYFRIGLAIANAPQMPAWKPGDEFEAARKKAIAEVKD